MSAAARHAPLPHLQQAGPLLHIGGRSVAELAAVCGGTPYYAYSRRLIEDRVAALRAALPAAVGLHYAIKANPMPAVVQLLRGLVDGFDVASQAELRLALDAGMPAAAVSFAGPGKREAEIRAAVAAGATVNAESLRELHLAADSGRALGLRPRVALRINPDFALKGSGMRMTGSPSQFGIDAEQAEAALALAAELELEFRGLHIYSGSQNLRHEAIVEANDATFELAFRLCRAAPAPPRFLNIGGGYGIPYFPGDEPLDPAPIGANLGRWLPRVAAELGADCQVVVELGRYLVGEAGFYVTRILDRKISKGEVFLVCDGGLHHHLANSGNFGQVLRKNYPVLIGNRLDEAATETATICGPLCTPLDVVAAKLALPHAVAGDYVVVAQSGAYGLTASPRGFLSHPEPGEILV